MADLPSHPDSDSGVGRERRPGTGRAGWKAIAGIVVAVVLIVVFVVLHLTGVLGPGQH